MNLTALLGKKSDLLGIDIGSRTVKVVHVSRKGSSPELRFCGMTETGDFTSLKNYLSQQGLSGLQAATCLEDPSLKIRKVEVPDMPEGDLKEAVKWKIREVLDGPAEEFVVRSSLLEKISTPDMKKLMLVGYAIRRKAVAEMIKKMAASGVRATFIEPGSVSFAAAVERASPSGTDWVAGVDLGAAHVVMVIVGQGKLYYSRPLPGIASSGDEGYNQRLAAEMQNTIDTFTVSFKVDRLQRIFLGGGGATRPGLTDYLSANLAVETKVLDPFGEMAGKPDEPHLYGQALSLAMSS
ncbi:MAG: pilus assembly protein PilM [Deltaproteobacteria bacterium]|nr:pilus assembly protein PilM [Deltaproteobacteria bacterium]